MKRLIIIGAGKFGRELAAYAEESLPGLKIAGFLDSRPHILDGYRGYPPIIGTVEDHAIGDNEVFVCGIGYAESRLAYAEIIEHRGGKFISVIHPRAYVGKNTILGDGCVLAPGAVVSTDCVLGRHVLVNANVYIGHDCHVGDGCVFSPLSSSGGMSRFGRRVFMGISSSIIPERELGDDVYVAAGAVVINSVASGVVMGVPARPKKPQKVAQA